MAEEQKSRDKIIPIIKMVAEQTKEDEESVSPPQKIGRMASEANMVVNVKQQMLTMNREDQAINHFERTTNEIMEPLC